MEYVFALLALSAIVVYAVAVAVGLERGRPWAREVADAVAMIEPTFRPLPEHAARAPVTPIKRARSSDEDRLAA
jgi:hypothetical protein